MPSKGGQKDINDLKKLVVANGFKLVPNGSGHLKLLNKRGQVVVDDNGPVIVSSTASDHRARDMHVQRLLKAGALKSDPWKPDSKKDQDSDSVKAGRIARLTSEEVKEKRRAADEKNSKLRQENTNKLRARVEPFIAAIGGWNKSGNTSEFGRAAFIYLTNRNRTEVWGSEGSALQNAHSLKMGNTLSDKAVQAWNIFMDEIERSGSTIEERRARYFEIVRESKGLATTAATVHPPAEEPPEQRRDILGVAALVKQRESGSEVEATMPTMPEVAAKLNGSYRTPTLALKALAEMMIGTADGTGLLPESDVRRSRALDIAEEILEMEIRTMLGLTMHGVAVEA